MTYVTYTQIDQMKKQYKGGVAYSKRIIIILKHIIELVLDKYTSSKEKKKLLQFT